MEKRQVIIVGAGMSGLTAARRLSELGISSLVLDKGRAVGGRMATRRIGGAVFDHGAQHFSARSAEFRAAVSGWMDLGVVQEWYRGASITRPERGIEPRHVGTGGMRRLPEFMARGLDVQTAVQIAGLELVAGGGVRLVASGGAAVAEGAVVVMTPPVPQSVQLLVTAGIEPTEAQTERLDSVQYDATLALMATPDLPPALSDGHLAPQDDKVAWIADNQHKGASELPALTVHSTAAFAADHIDGPKEAWVEELLDAASSLLGVGLSDPVGHGWRYSQPRTTLDIGAMSLAPGWPIVLAGEAFMGAKVEGAFLSGLAAAQEAVTLLDAGSS